VNVILHNKSQRLIEGPRALGASRLWSPGKTPLTAEEWSKCEGAIASYPPEKGKHLLQHLLDEGDIEIDKSAKELPPPPTAEQFEAMTDKEVEKLAGRTDLPVTWAEPIVKELGRREKAAAEKSSGKSKKN
jgi:hypothetical protein